MRQFMTAVLLLMTGVSASVAVACENAVRDAAFRGPRDTHRLCLITASDDEPAQREKLRLEKWLQNSGAGLNLELVHLHADDPDLQWEEYGIPSAPPVLPVVALIGKNYGTGETFLINHWEPAPTDDELQALADSPVRRQLQKVLGPALAVILHVPGEQSKPEKMKRIFESVKADWLAKELPAIEVVTLDRNDPREQTLVSFMGLPPDGPDVAAVVFGRGKLMSPPLQGMEISQKQLNQLVDQIYQDCNCSKPLTSLGVDVPLVWNEELAKSFVPVSEPSTKPEDPRLANLPGMGTLADDDAAPKVIEESGNRQAEGPPETLVPDTPSVGDGQLIRNTLITLGVFGVVLVLATVIIVRRKP